MREIEIFLLLLRIVGHVCVCICVSLCVCVLGEQQFTHSVHANRWMCVADVVGNRCHTNRKYIDQNPRDAVRLR